MGKARILSAQGEGLYSIEILEDRTRAESLKQRALQRIAEIDDELAALESEWEQARLAVDAAAAAQDQAIEQHQAEILATGESSVDLQAYAQAVLDAAAARDAIRTRIGSLNLERLSRQGWVDRVDALPPLRTQAAWCADHTEDLSGEVATAEVPGEVGQVIIKPGFDGNAWSASADGAMQPALASTPAGVFYNLAMMPGWQKWRPTFRIATITAINNDLCDITLDSASSSQQGLNVNAHGSYSGVPIYYMDCNGAAFESGDRVLVAFSGNTDQPMVVGFEQEPRICKLRSALIFCINVSPEKTLGIMERLEEMFFPSGEDQPNSFPGFYIQIQIYHESWPGVGFAFGYMSRRSVLRAGAFLEMYYEMLAQRNGGWNTTHRYLGTDWSNFEDTIAMAEAPAGRVHFFHFSRWYQAWNPYNPSEMLGHYKIRENVMKLHDDYGYTQFGYPSLERDYTLMDFGGELGHFGEVSDQAVYDKIWSTVQSKKLLSRPE